MASAISHFISPLFQYSFVGMQVFPFWSVDLIISVSSFLFNNNFKYLKFIVGSTDGIQKDILEKSNKVISLSKMTLTHSFALIILLEQIYRSATIVSNHPYHRV